MISTQTERTPTDCADTNHLAMAVHAALGKSPYLAAKAYRIEATEGRVQIHGEVGTYFEKQMAQETVLRLDGVELVENLLQVSWT